jgi:hypothetical protein
VGLNCSGGGGGLCTAAAVGSGYQYGMARGLGLINKVTRSQLGQDQFLLALFHESSTYIADNYNLEFRKQTNRCNLLPLRGANRINLTSQINC